VWPTDDETLVFQFLNMPRKRAWKGNSIKCSDTNRRGTKCGRPQNCADRRNVRVVCAQEGGHALKPKPHMGPIGGISGALQREAEEILGNRLTGRPKPWISV
jgi:hypothetical protein